MSRGALRSFLAVVLTLAVLGFVGSASAQWPAAGRWLEVSNSNLSSVLPVPLPDVGYNGPEAIMSAWSGGAFDTTRDQLLVWGGGHADYGGNEVYAFGLTARVWSRLTNPSPTTRSTAEALADGRPTSRHTYAGLAYAPTYDRMFAAGGSLWWDGHGSKGAWLFDPAAKTWLRRADMPDYQLTTMVAYDPESGLVFSLVRSGDLVAYDPATNSWTVRGGTGMWAEYDPARTMVVHPTAQALLIVGGGEVLRFDLSQSYAEAQPMATAGGDPVVDVQGPGLAYDPVLDRIVGWAGGGDVYSLDLASGLWTRHSPTGGVVPTAQAWNGTYGRFQYVPSQNVYVAVNSIYENVFLFRLTDGGSVPPPPSGDTTPPSITGTTVSEQTTTQATVAWNTDETTTGKVEYGLTTAYGRVMDAPSTGQFHSLTLTGLAPTTTYNARVRAKDIAGNETVSANTLVTTLTPAASSVSATRQNWTLTSEVRAPAAPAADVTVVIPAGLTDRVRKIHRATAVDPSKNSKRTADLTFTSAGGTPPPGDTTPPTISGITVSGITASSAVIAWQTNEATTGSVQYGTTTSYGASVADGTRTTSHSVMLGSLTAQTVYHYRVTAVDASANSAAGSDLTFTTAGGTPPPPPPGGGMNLPLRTWVSRPLPAVGQGPMPAGWGGKHSRLLHDTARGRMVLTGGDYENPFGPQDGNSQVWSIRLDQGDAWTLLAPWCAPAGGLQPASPDNVVWVYDATRDQGIIMRGFYFGTQGDVRCPGVTESLDSLRFDFATQVWVPPGYPPPPGGYGGDLGSTYGVYDPVSDGVYRFRWTGGWGNVMEVLSLGSQTWETVALGSGDDPIRNTDAHADQSVIDVTGRNIYVISRVLGALLRYDIDARHVVETIPLPSQWVPPAGSDHETWMAFDPIHRVVLIPVNGTSGYSGDMLGLAIYHVDTKQWEWEAISGPVGGYPVKGNVVGFDVTNNALMLIGGHYAQVFWLYRYGN